MDTSRRAANEAIGRRFFAEQDRRKGPPAPELCAPGYRAWLGGQPPMPYDGHAAFGRAFYEAFPDIGHTIEDVFATDDRVAVRFVLHGTHEAPFFGIPATGRAVTVAANVLLTIEDGRVTVLKGIFDEAGLLRQLGVLP